DERGSFRAGRGSPVRTVRRRLPQPLRELSRRRARVVRLGEGADDDHPAGARVQDLVEVAEVDAADGEPGAGRAEAGRVPDQVRAGGVAAWLGRGGPAGAGAEDRKSTRLNSSHVKISY